MQYTVGVSDMKVVEGTQDLLITYALGSCVGVSVYDPTARVGGLIHCLLPLSRTDPAKAATFPAMYVDTGIVALFKALLERGARKGRFVTCVAGGARPLDLKDAFRIGERNYATVRKLLWKQGILIDAEDVGGEAPRTMSLNMETGVTSLKSRGEEWQMN